MSIVIPPQIQITNSELQAKLYLPDPQAGYYRATRFDWSGVISSLRYRGHEFYGQWFHRTDPAVLDFIYAGDEIVAGLCSSVTGPAEEFQVLGFDEAAPGEAFLKIGVGVLRRPDAAPYQPFRSYEIIDPGTWSVTSSPDSVQFQQQLSAPDGSGYLYTKQVRLLPGEPRMVIEHRFTNTGRLRIASNVYNHNFIAIDGHGTGAGLSVRFPFALEGDGRLPKELAEISGREIRYRRDLRGEDTAATTLSGFGPGESDYDISVESTVAGAGVRLRADRPISRLELWSIRSVVGVEPYLAFSVGPAEEFTWDLTFDFYEPSPTPRERL